MEDLIEEINEVLVEYGFQERWTEIEKWWKIGEILIKGNATPIIIKRIANIVEVQEDCLWDAVLFNKKFPDLGLLKEGKDVSWNKIKEKYL